MIGSLGVALSMICFGLSRTLMTMIVSRALSGLLNGNIGVVKAALSEVSSSFAKTLFLVSSISTGD